MKNFLRLIVVLVPFFAVAQNSCALPASTWYPSLQVVDVNGVKCIAQNNNTKTLVWTFGIWCEPCRLHYKNAYTFATENKLGFYVLLIENHTADNRRISSAIQFLRDKYPEVKILIADNKYGTKPARKNKNFLTEITPSNFENIDDMSKYILINNEGSVEMVTNYNDFEGDNWQDDSGIIKRRLLPLVNKSFAN